MAFNQFVGVPSPSSVYVGVPDYDEFNKINVKALDHRTHEDPSIRKPVLTKAVVGDEVTVVFQHWLDE